MIYEKEDGKGLLVLQSLKRFKLISTTFALHSSTKRGAPKRSDTACAAGFSRRSLVAIMLQSNAAKKWQPEHAGTILIDRIMNRDIAANRAARHLRLLDQVQLQPIRDW